MLTMLGQFFASDKNDYISIVISLCDVSFTILSILTILISIYYENCILKLKQIKWRVKQTNKINEIKDMLFEYEYMKNNQIPFYDKIIRFFKVICYLLLIIYCMIYIITITTIESIGALIILYASIGVLVAVLIAIATVFKTSKKNREIIDYKQFFNYTYADEIYDENVEIKPKFNIQAIHNKEATLEIEQIFPIYLYNVVVTIEIDHKVYIKVNLKDRECNNYNENYKYEVKGNCLEVNKYIFEHVDKNSKIKVYMSKIGSKKNEIKSFDCEFVIHKEEEYTRIEMKDCKVVADRITRIAQDFITEESKEDVKCMLI